MKYDIDELLIKSFKSKESQGEIRPSNVLNQETISKMREINNMKKSKKGKLNILTKIAVGVACAGLIVGTSTVAYSAIAKIYKYTIEMDNGVTVDVHSSNQLVELPQDSLADVDDTVLTMQWKQVEEMLGIPLLGGTDEMINLMFHRNSDESVAVVDLWVPYYKVYGEPRYTEEGDAYYSEYIRLSMDILDKNAEPGYIEAFEEGKDAIGGKEFIEKHNIEELGIEATLYYVENDHTRITAVFVYEGVYYSLEGTGVTLEEMKEVINSMK